MLTFFESSKLLRRFLRYPAFYYEDNERSLLRLVQSEWNDYELWLYRNRLFTLSSLKTLHRQVRQMKIKPKVSIIMPVFNPLPAEIQQAIESVQWQAYPYWELCIVDDFSADREYLSLLKGLRDSRVKVFLRDTHSGIAETSQYALEKATGDYVALMDQDDELYPDALFSFAEALQSEEIDFFYSDRDMISPQGKRYMHFFRPGWSPEYLLSFNYVPHLEIYDKKLLLGIGGFRRGYDGSQDYDLVLRATEQTARIYHCPRVLYSWRQSRGSVAGSPDSKGYAFEAGVRALKDTVKRRKLPARDVVENTDIWRGHYKIIWDEEALSGEPVSFVVIGGPKDELSRVVSLLKNSSGCPANSSFVTADYTVRSINAALKDIQGGVVFFCVSSITDIVSAAFTDLLGYLAIDGVSVVGCKFLDKENKIFSAGLAITDSGKVLSAYRGHPCNEHGYGAVASVPRNVSAVFPFFWGCRVNELRERGSLKEGADYFYSAMSFFKDCIQSGKRIVCVPYMCLKADTERLDYHEGSNAFLEKWKSDGMRDRYYNPNLTDLFEDFGVRM